MVPSITGSSWVSCQSHSITLFADIQKSYDLYWIAISIINFHKMDYIKWLVSCHVYGVKSHVGTPTHRRVMAQPNATCAGRNAWDWMLGFSIPTPAQLVSALQLDNYGLGWEWLIQVKSFLQGGWDRVGGGKSQNMYCVCVFFVCVFFVCQCMLKNVRFT